MKTHFLFLLTLITPSLMLAQAGWNWALIDSGTTSNLRDVDMLNPNFGVAVGEDSTVMFWNGSSWTPATGFQAQSEYTSAGSVATVKVLGENLVIVGGSKTGTGANGGLAVWNGSTWSPSHLAAGGGVPMSGLWSDGNGLILASFSFATRISRYNSGNNAVALATSGNWALEHNGGASSPSLFAIHGSSVNSIFAVGIRAPSADPAQYGIFRSTDGGQTWSVSPGSATLTKQWYGIYALADDWALATGTDGRVAFWDGVAWSESQIPGYAGTLRDAYALSKDQVWVVGNSGALFYYDGVEWEKVLLTDAFDTPITDVLYGIDYDGESLWIVGNNGRIFQTAIPEPAWFGLILAGVAGVMWFHRRSRNKASSSV